MENRFGFRELVISVLLLAMIGSVWLAMVEFDRQGVQLRQMQEQITEQTRDLAQIHRLVEQGVPVASQGTMGATSTTAPGPAATQMASDGDDVNGTWMGAGVDPFRRVRAAEKMSGYAVGDNLVQAFGVLPTKLTPLISSDAYSAAIQNDVLESLIGRDPDTLDWQPQLATKWRISKDGLRIEFEIRRGVSFSDGEPMTVDDVLFSYQWALDPAVEDPRVKSYLEKIVAVKQTGPDRVAFFFKEPYFQALELAGGLSVMPKHFYGKLSPADFNRSTGLLMGTGPYMMPDPAGWKPEPGKPIELVRNERYWGDPAPFTRMVFRIIDNDAARLTTFRNGDLDTLSPSPEQYKSMMDDKPLLARTQHYEYDEPGAGYRYIGWNQMRDKKPTIFADKRVRQAMTMVIDREQICKQIMMGLARVATGPFNPLTKQYDQSIKPWPYDLAKAKALLKEAGFEDRDGSGILSKADGTRLSFKLSFNASNDTYKRMVLFIKDTCAGAGVQVIPEPVAWSLLIERLDQRNFDAVTLGWTGGIEDDPYQIFHSSQIEGTGDDFISYKNEELDKLIVQARATVQEDERMPIWHRVHQILHEDQPYTFIMVSKALVFVDKRFQNILMTKNGLNPDTEWFVPRPLWKWTKPH